MSVAEIAGNFVGMCIVGFIVYEVCSYLYHKAFPKKKEPDK